MRAFVVILAAVLLGATLLGSSGPGAAGAPRPSDLSPATTYYIQQTSTLLRSFPFTQTYWQNGSATYASGSSPVVIPSNAGGLTGIFEESYTLGLQYRSFSGTLTPLVNATQGSTLLANATAYYYLPLFPSISANPVVVKVPTAFTPSATYPSVGTYTATGVANATIAFFNLTAPGWTPTTGLGEKLTYVVPVPSGYTLNQTTIFVPWPTAYGIVPGSLNVTVGGVAATSVSIIAGGFYLGIPGLSATTTVQVSILVGSTSSGWVSVPLGKSYVLNGIAQQYQANATYLNTGTIPFAGGFLITTNLSYSISSLNINISENGHYLKNGSFVLAGTVFEILPNSIVVPAGYPAVFSVKYYLVGAPPSVTASLTTPIVGAFTLGDLILLAMLVCGAVVVIGLFRVRRSAYVWSTAHQSGYWWGALFFLALLIIVYTALWLKQHYG